MKNYTKLLFVFLLLLSCGKKTTMKGRIVNPVTNTGIAGIKVIVTKPKKCLGYDGCGSKTIYETVSDENGYFLIEKRFRRSKSYTIAYVFDKNKYRRLEAQVSPAGAEYDGEEFEFPLIPLGYLRPNIKNINCQNNNDELLIHRIYLFDSRVYGTESSTYGGCYNFEFSGSIDGSPNGFIYAPMGWHKAIGTVTKNNITTPYADSIYVTEGGYHVWNIEY